MTLGGMEARRDTQILWYVQHSGHHAKLSSERSEAAELYFWELSRGHAHESEQSGVQQTVRTYRTGRWGEKEIKWIIIHVVLNLFVFCFVINVYF